MFRPKMLVTSWTICFCVDSFPNGLLQIKYNQEIFFLYSCLPSCLIIRFMGLWVAIIIIMMMIGWVRSCHQIVVIIIIIIIIMIGWVGLAIKLLLHARKPSLDQRWATVVTPWEFNLFSSSSSLLQPTSSYLSSPSSPSPLLAPSSQPKSHYKW